MIAERRSPAASEQASRAAKASNPSSYPQKPKYSGMLQLVESNPTSEPDEIRADPSFIGTLFLVGNDWHAFDRYDRTVGVFGDRRRAATHLFTGSLPSRPVG